MSASETHTEAQPVEPRLTRALTRWSHVHTEPQDTAPAALEAFPLGHPLGSVPWHLLLDGCGIANVEGGFFPEVREPDTRPVLNLSPATTRGDWAEPGLDRRAPHVRVRSALRSARCQAEAVEALDALEALPERSREALRRVWVREVARCASLALGSL